MKRVSALSTGCLVLLLGGMLTACGEDAETKHSDIKQYMKTVKSRAPRPIEALPEPKEYPIHNYTMHTQSRSPFKPYLLKRRTKGKNNGPDQNRPKAPLEAFPLDSLRMVGILDEGTKRWALVMASDGIVYRITEGNYLGQNYGKVEKITKNNLLIIETVQLENEWRQRQAELVLVE